MACIETASLRLRWAIYTDGNRADDKIGDVILIGSTPEVQWSAWQTVSSKILTRVTVPRVSLYIPLSEATCADGCRFFTQNEMYYADQVHLHDSGAIGLCCRTLDQRLIETLGDPNRD